MKISDYGVIGNGRTAALVSREGSIDWCSFPHFDSPSTFGALLDQKKGGAFWIHPAGPFSHTQSYIDETNVLETRFTTETGTVRLVDTFTATSEAAKKNRLWPTDEILRVVEGVSGEVQMDLSYWPRPRYGDERFRMKILDRGPFGFGCTCGDSLLLLRSSLSQDHFRAANGALEAQFRLRAGERAIFSLIYSDEAPAIIPPLGAEAVWRLEETIRYWQDWVSHCRYQGPYQAHVRRAALALKLLVFAPSGAVVAAPTTSLPEVPGGERNWDYRFCWLRDASFTIRGLLDLGFHDEAGAFVSWMLHTTRLTRPKLQVVYTLYGEARLEEENIPWLGGYAGSRPVRIGNKAAHQFQLDIYGEFLEGFFHYTPFMDKIDGETRNLLLDIGRGIHEMWDQPDDGIWEMRARRMHHTHSKALAWAGLNRLIQMCRRYGWKAPLDAWSRSRDELRRAIETRAYNSALGSYTRALDGNELDASVLVLPRVGYCDASAPRMQSTLSAIEHHLSENGLLYRYRPESDGLPGKEGCFGICSFWYAEDLARSGRTEDAHQWLQSLFKRANHVGLWSEEIDPKSGDFLGNYPQAFTHIGLIHAVAELARAESRVGVAA